MLDPSARVQARVTLPEGLRLDETLKRLAKETKLPLADYEKALKQRGRQLGLPGVRQGQPGGLPLPGHLRRAARTPTADVGPQAAVHGLGRPPPTKSGVARTKRTPEEIVIIASLVEAEARNAEDFGKVARVVYNRLEQGCRCSSTPRSTTRSRRTSRS